MLFSSLCSAKTLTSTPRELRDNGAPRYSSVLSHLSLTTSRANLPLCTSSHALLTDRGSLHSRTLLSPTSLVLPTSLPSANVRCFLHHKRYSLDSYCFSTHQPTLCSPSKQSTLKELSLLTGSPSSSALLSWTHCNLTPGPCSTRVFLSSNPSDPSFAYWGHFSVLIALDPPAAWDTADHLPRFLCLVSGMPCISGSSLLSMAPAPMCLPLPPLCGSVPRLSPWTPLSLTCDLTGFKSFQCSLCVDSPTCASSLVLISELQTSVAVFTARSAGPLGHLWEPCQPRPISALSTVFSLNGSSTSMKAVVLTLTSRGPCTSPCFIPNHSPPCSFCSLATLVSLLFLKHARLIPA